MWKRSRISIMANANCFSFCFFFLDTFVQANIFNECHTITNEWLVSFGITIKRGFIKHGPISGSTILADAYLGSVQLARIPIFANAHSYQKSVSDYCSKGPGFQSWHPSSPCWTPLSQLTSLANALPYNFFPPRPRLVCSKKKNGNHKTKKCLMNHGPIPAQRSRRMPPFVPIIPNKRHIPFESLSLMPTSDN